MLSIILFGNVVSAKMKSAVVIGHTVPLCQPKGILAYLVFQF